MGNCLVLFAIKHPCLFYVFLLFSSDFLKIISFLSFSMFFFDNLHKLVDKLNVHFAMRETDLNQTFTLIHVFSFKKTLPKF